jgi:hypothetical protein
LDDTPNEEGPNENIDVENDPIFAEFEILFFTAKPIEIQFVKEELLASTAAAKWPIAIFPPIPEASD